MKNIFQIPFASGYESSIYRNFIYDFFKLEPEFLKSVPVLVKLNRKSGSGPVSGRIIRFRPYPSWTMKIVCDKILSDNGKHSFNKLED